MTTQQLGSLTGEYVVDGTHSRLGFVARHAMITKVRGQFNEFEGRAHIDFEDPARSTVEATITVQSIDTHNEQRDGHLRSNDFFDAPNHPQITFRSTGVTRQSDETYEVEGDLTIKGTTKQVSIPFEFTGTAKDPFGNTRVGFEGSLTVNRKDWGIEWNAPLETGGVLVSEKVTLELEISAIKTEG
ncbi:YceI family protein [Nocardioides iriomotensis]|uniref:Polyisoprenoid-binding protein n=1 Tax=Nocardioides iriomotensis TaxID=715784 RepID=A0A4V1Z130_9ACTN|nr:YceI family protein [Nocardioides iriomotensis]RYU09476.1 polyisoprenoid-binding protein [Nocardioides iriomotensis]